MPLEKTEDNIMTKNKTLKIVALLLTMVLMTGMLASCGTKLSGAYESELLGLTFEFKSGGKVIFTYPSLNLSSSILTEGLINSATSEGTYEISKDKTTITFHFGDEGAKDYEGDSSLEIGTDYIKIDSVTFTKVKK